MKNNNSNINFNKLQIALDYNKVKSDTTNQDVSSINFLASLLKRNVTNDILNIIETMIKAEVDALEKKRLSNIFTTAKTYKKVNLSLEYSNMYFGTIQKIVKYLATIENRDEQKIAKKLFNKVDKKQSKSEYNKELNSLLPKKEKSSNDIYENIIKEIDLISVNDLNKLLALLQEKI